MNPLRALVRRVSTLSQSTPVKLARLCAPLLLLAPLAAQAQLSPQVTKGLGWLQAQVKADGTLAAEGASIAMPLQARSETLHTLKLLGAPVASMTPLQSSLAAETEANTEFVSRRVWSLGYSGITQQALVQVLEQRQNGDGGYGGAPGYASQARDTAFVLRAQKESPVFGAASVVNALAYLAAARNADGSFGKKNQGQLYDAVQTLLAAQSWTGQPGAGDILLSGQQWLLSQRNASLQFGSAHDNALSLWALTGVTTQTAILQPLVDALHAAQAADGSWNGDPYVTAIALRALFRVTQAPPANDGTALHGTVIDAATSAALAGVTVQVLGGSATTSDTRGQFAFASLAAGSQTLRFSRIGYASRDVALTITAGQNLNVGNIALAASSLTATLNGVVRDQNGTALANATIAVGTASALTDATGAYKLTGLSAGAATATVSLANYQSVTVQLSFAAGTTYVFSPRLIYGSGSTPTTTSITGSVIDSASKAAIAGASVKWSTLNVTTVAGGAFTLSPAATGAFTVTIAAPGYQGVVVSGVAVAGVNNIGAIALVKLPTTSTLSGTVTDGATGKPLAAVSVRVDGQGVAVLTGADGKYVLGGLTGTSFTLKSSASGYVSRADAVSLNQVGAALADIVMQPQAMVDSDVSFLRVQTPNASYPASGVIPLELVLANGGTASTAVQVSALVINEQDSVVHEYLASPIVGWMGLNYGNKPVNIAAKSTLELALDWNALRVAAGTYRVKAQALDANGRLVAEADTSFTISAAAALAGGVTADPPLAQAGAKTPISLTGDVTNSGNLTLPAGELSVRVLLERADPADTRAAETVLNTAASGLPMANPVKLRADGKGNLYSVNYSDRKVIRINGAVQTVLATLPAGVSPVDLSLDADGNVYVAVASPARVYKVGLAGDVSFVLLSQLSSISAFDMAPNGSFLVAGRAASGEQRLVERSAAGVETVLQRNGLSTPTGITKDGSGNYVLSNYGDGTLSRVNAADGAITPLASGINGPRGLAYGPDGFLYVAAAGVNKIVKVSPAGVVSDFASGLNQPYDVKFDASGNLFASNAGDNTVARINPSGVVEIFARGVANTPMALRYDSAGNLWSTNNDGTLRKLDTLDQASVVATGLSTPRGLAIDANGDVLVVEYGAGRVTRVSNGVKTTFASGLASPYGIAIDGAGVVHVTEYGGHRIARFDASGNKLGVTESKLVSPGMTRVAANGDVYIQGSSRLSRYRAGALDLVLNNFGYSYWTPDSATSSLIALSGNSVLRVSEAGVVTTIKANLPFTPYGVAIAADGAILLTDLSNYRIQKLAADGTVSILASVPAYPGTNSLQADTSGNVFIRPNNNVFYRVMPDGALVPVTHTVADYIYNWSVAGNGQIVGSTYYRTYRIDALAGTTSVWLADRGYYTARPIHMASGDQNGNLVGIDSNSHGAYVFNASGAETAAFVGFQNPLDIVWTGSEMRFSGNANLMQNYVGDAYPARMAGALPASFLAQVGADTVGANGGTSVYKWTGTGGGYTTYASVPASATGIAARADGGFTVGETATSRVVAFNNAKAVIKDYAGIVSPQGMVFDAAGRLYVANYGAGTIARFESASSPSAMTFARVGTPVALSLDGTGKVLVARSSSVSRLGLDGTETQISSGQAFSGLLGDGANVYGVNASTSQLHKLVTVNGVSSWPVFAAGLSTPSALRAAPDGSAYVLSRSNNSLARYAAGKLETIATIPAGMNAIDLGANGDVVVAGNAGVGVRINASRASSALGFAQLASNFAIAGVVDAGAGKVYAIGINDASQPTSALFELTVTAPTAPPPAGSVVYTASVPMAELEANGTYAHFDFGKWVAPYGGDFKVEMFRDGVDGKSSNFIHVGSNAQSQLTAASTEVPPGDSELAMCLDLKGADFTSISRVEMGQVRPISMSGFPNGMAGDKAGNLYVTDSTSLYRTSANGASTLIANGMSLSFGLATDADQNFYVASLKAATGRYELLRIDLAGTKTVVADLGVTRANGVQLNSKDEVLVGSPGKLLKVDKQGVVSVVSTAGLGSPRGIAVDGRDNVYVQNDDNKVSMIKPDGTTVSIYSTGNGNDEPAFEGDGYPNIAADCADNFYIGTSQWAKIGQYGEEHTLAQVVPRTGTVALLFDTSKVNPELSDIDYLAFDRFSNRLLMWNHGSNRIWQVPVTCGAIGVEAHLVTQPGQTLSGATLPPAASVARADGSTEYVWSLRDVTAQGAQVCFRATEKNFALGEERAAIDSGFISFSNSFSSGDVTVPLAVPKVRAANLVKVGAATDKPEYLANEFVQVTATLNNSNPVTVAGDLRVDLYDAANTLMASVLQQGVTLPVGGALKVDGAYNVGATVPGTYTARATLSNDTTVLAQAAVSFKVLADAAQVAASSTLALDKQQYAASDRVTISSRALSQSQNVVLENMTLALQLFDMNNAQLFAKTYQINQLAPGRTLDFASQYQLKGALPGTYRVTQTLRDAEGRAYGTQNATFTVASSADTGYGLSGTIEVAPNPVKIGENLALSFTATNQGNSALNGLPLMVRVVDPVRQAVLSEYPYTTSIAINASYNAATGWLASGTAGDTYVAVLVATVGGKQLTLASQRFVLIDAPKPAVKLEVRQALANGSRVLVLVSCNDGENNTAGSDGKPPVCETERYQAIDAALTKLGVMHKITTNEEAFTRAFRSGLYNTYWISGKEDKLHNDLPAEVREATFGGDSLILDGVHDERNKVFDTVAGVRYFGKIGEQDLPIRLSGSWYEPQRLFTVGRALKPGLDGSTQQAAFDGLMPHTDGPGIISNVYGNGQSALFAFDLVQSLRADEQWLPVLGTTLKAVMPEQGQQVAPGSVMRVMTTVSNQANSTDVDVKTVLPAGALFLEASEPGLFNASGMHVDWRFNLGPSESRDLFLSLRAPATVGNYLLDTAVGSVVNGTITPYGDRLALAFTVTGATPTSVTVKANLKALVLTRQTDKKARDNAIVEIDAAMVAFNRNTAAGYLAAIHSLVNAGELLASITAADTSGARLGVDRILREAQWRWSTATATP